jgi:hypothetical protein
MNDLGLPPHRTMPPDVRERVRTRVNAPAPTWTARSRAPLSVAAAVALLTLGAVIIGQSTDNGPMRAGTPPTSSATVTQRTVLPHYLLSVTMPDTQAEEDLDHCWAVVAASPRAGEFAPRTAWQPIFTTTMDDTRLTAYREYGGKPGFCEITGNTAIVSDPSAEPMNLLPERPGDTVPRPYALYVSPSGLMAGVAQGVDRITFSSRDADGNRYMASSEPYLDELFVKYVGDLATGWQVEVTGLDANGQEAYRGVWAYDKDEIRPEGATGQF